MVNAVNVRTGGYPRIHRLHFAGVQEEENSASKHSRFYGIDVGDCVPRSERRTKNLSVRLSA